MLLNGGSFNGHRIFSPKTVEMMTVDHLGEITFPWFSGAGFGLGFYIREDLGVLMLPGSVGEFGWGGMYHSIYWVDPEEDLVVVYLTQVITATGLDDYGKLRTLVCQALVD